MVVSVPPRKTSTDRFTHRVGGLHAMRALAHPTRVRMMHLLRAEPLSASELARRLGIRFGSAQYHLRSLERAGIALRVGERSRRGGTEYPVRGSPRTSRWTRGRTPGGHAPGDEPRLRRRGAPPDGRSRRLERLRHRSRRASRRARWSSTPTASTPRPRRSTTFLHRLDELALARPTEDSTTFTVGTLFLQMPGT